MLKTCINYTKFCRKSELKNLKIDRKEKRLMILKEALDLSKNIADYRLDMYELVKSKGLSDPDVIKISQQLDKKILMIQKIQFKIHPS